MRDKYDEEVVFIMFYYFRIGFFWAVFNGSGGYNWDT